MGQMAGGGGGAGGFRESFGSASPTHTSYHTAPLKTTTGITVTAQLTYYGRWWWCWWISYWFRFRL